MRELSVLEQLCFCTTRIETEDTLGNSFSGTGFFYNLEINGDTIPLIVTNKHVVENMKTGRFKMTKEDEHGNPVYTDHLAIRDEASFSGKWVPHPDPNIDLCILPIASLLTRAREEGHKLFYRTLSADLIPPQNDLDQLDAVEEIIMIGYPNGLWDSVNNMPIIRRGITATPVYLNYEGKKEFVIDAACFPGSSGSPVLLCDKGGYTDKKGKLKIGAPRVMFLGVLYAGPQLTVTGEIKVVTIPNIQQVLPISRIPNNLGYIIKSECLLDFIPIIEAMLSAQP